MSTNPTNDPNCDITISTIPERYICNDVLNSVQFNTYFYVFNFGATTTSLDNKIWSLVNPPPNVSINSDTGELLWNNIHPAYPIPPLYDPYVLQDSGPITVRVSLDGDCSGSFDELTFNLTVVYNYPLITNIPNSFCNGLFSHQLIPSTSVNTTFTNSWELSLDAPLGMTISPSGLLEWIIPNGTTTVDLFHVILTQTDAHGCNSSYDAYIQLYNNLDIFLPIRGANTLPCGVSSFSQQAQTTSTTPVTWSLSGVGHAITDNPPNRMLISSTGLITWTPAPGVTSSGLVTVTVSSPGCGSTSDTFTLSIIPPPAFNLTIPPTNEPAYWGHNWHYTLTSTSPGSFQLLDHPTGMILSPLNSTQANLLWTPPWDTVTSGLIRVRFFNACNESVDLTFTLFPMDPPFITSAPPTGPVCSSFSYQVTTIANPSHTHPLIYSLSGGQASTLIPIGNRMVVSNTGLITWTPGSGVTSSGAVTLVVTNNGCGFEDRMTFTISVVCGIVIDPYEPVMHCCACGEEFSHQMTCTPSNPSDLWSLVGVSGVNYPLGMVISNSGLLTWTPPHGIITSGPVTIRVTNSHGDSATLTITIPVNDGPTITSIAPSGPASIITQDVPFTFLLTSTDPNNNLLLEPWSLLEVIPAGMTISHITNDPDKRAIISWTPSPSQSGLFNIRVRVTDQCSLSDNLEFNLRVHPVGVTPPVFITNPSLEACDCQQYVYEPMVSGGEEPLEWSLLSGPLGMVINPSTGRLTWTPGLCCDGHSVGGHSHGGHSHGGHSPGGHSHSNNHHVDHGHSAGGHSHGKLHGHSVGGHCNGHSHGHSNTYGHSCGHSKDGHSAGHITTGHSHNGHSYGHSHHGHSHGHSHDLCCGGEYSSGPVKIMVMDSVGSSETQEFFIDVCQCVYFEPIHDGHSHGHSAGGYSHGHSAGGHSHHTGHSHDHHNKHGHKMRSNVTPSGAYVQLTGNVYDIPAKFTLCEESLITHGNTSLNFLHKTFHLTSTGPSVLDMPVILVIYYTDAELAAMGPLSEDRLKGFVWSPVTMQWVYLKTKVYAKCNKVEIEIDQLIGADYNLAKVAPVPVEITNLNVVQTDLSTLDATVEFNARDIDMDDVKLTYQWKLASAPSNAWKVAKTTPPLSRIGGSGNFIMYSILWTVKKEDVFKNNTSSQSVMFRIIANDDDGTTTTVDSSPFTIVLNVPLLAPINPNIPKITSKPKTSVRVGDAYIYEPEADKKSQVSYWQVTGLPSFLSFNTTTGKISGTPTLTYLGTYVITLKVFTTLNRMNTQVFVLTIKKK